MWSACPGLPRYRRVADLLPRVITVFAQRKTGTHTRGASHPRQINIALVTPPQASAPRYSNSTR